MRVALRIYNHEHKRRAGKNIQDWIYKQRNAPLDSCAYVHELLLNLLYTCFMANI